MLRGRERKEGCQSRQRTTRKSRHNSEDCPASEWRWEKRTPEKWKLEFREKRLWHLRWEMQRETAEWTLGRKDANFYWIIHYFYFIYLLFTLVLANSKAAASAIGCLLVSDRFYFVRMSLVNWWRFNLYFIDAGRLLGNSQTSTQAQQNKTNKHNNIENN